MRNSHLVILKKPYLDAILAGRKTIESRLMKNKCPPFGRVKQGDALFLKVSCGCVCAKATVAKVKSFENLTARRIEELVRRYNNQVLGTDEYWQSKADCKVGLLIWLENVETIEPVRINKKDWRAWVVLTKEKNFGLSVR